MTSCSSMQKLKDGFALIDPREFRSLMPQKGFRLLEQQHHPLPAGKAFWSGAFTRNA